MHSLQETTKALIAEQQRKLEAQANVLAEKEEELLKQRDLEAQRERQILAQSEAIQKMIEKQQKIEADHLDKISQLEMNIKSDADKATQVIA